MLKDFFLNEVKVAINKAISENKLGSMGANDEFSLIIEKPKNADFGDFAVNVSSLARVAKIAPPMIANSIIEYRTSFIVQALFMFVNNGFYLIFWNVVFGISNNQINGIEMKEIYYLWSIPTISYGIVYMLFGGISTISKNVVTGGMDSYLTQPKNVFINITNII